MVFTDGVPTGSVNNKTVAGNWGSTRRLLPGILGLGKARDGEGHRGSPLPDSELALRGNNLGASGYCPLSHRSGPPGRVSLRLRPTRRPTFSDGARHGRSHSGHSGAPEPGGVSQADGTIAQSLLALAGLEIHFFVQMRGPKIRSASEIEEWPRRMLGEAGHTVES